jgi:hypothetical protein
MCIGPGKKENQLVSKEARTYVRVNKGVHILGKGELLQDVGGVRQLVGRVGG